MKIGKTARQFFLCLTSVLLLAVAGWMAGVKNSLVELRAFPFWAVIVTLSLFGLNLVVVSFRLERLLSHFGMSLPAGVVSRASIAGHVAGLFFISLFGQVAGRHLVLRQFGLPSILIASLTAYERFVLLLVSGGLCLVGAALFMDSLDVAAFLSGTSLSEIGLASLAALALSLWLGRSKYESDLISKTHSHTNLVNIVELGAITLGAQLLILASFVVGVAALRPGIAYLDLFAAAAIISFSASLPITVNGWGIRELTAVFILGKLGVPNASALAVSILVGLCSTAVIVAAAPFSWKRPLKAGEAKAREFLQTGLASVEIEKAAVWLIGMAVAVLIFFQMHITLPGGVINLNLADPFAILGLAATVMHAVSTRQLPRWQVPGFNVMLFILSALLVFGFLRGVVEIGVTQWALAGRLMGWLVLLGYLSIGHLVVSHMGSHGLRRFSESMIATAVVVVTTQIILRWVNFHGWAKELHVALNFEGYAGNRNAFAVQLLVCSALVMAYSSQHVRAERLITREDEPGWLCRTLSKSRDSRLLIFSVLHGVILAGLAFSASRAGLIVGAVLLIAACWGRLANRSHVCLSVGFAIVIWLLPQLGPDLKLGGIQSQFSGEGSNQDRWLSITKGIEMWFEFPFFGAGLGVFIEKSKEWFSQPLVIHSTPIWVLAEFGLLGAVVFGGVFIALARGSFRWAAVLPSRRIAVMVLLLFAVFGLVHEIFYQRIIWLVLGGALATFGYTSTQHRCSRESHHGG